MIDADTLIAFLDWCEQKQRPRVRLCEWELHTTNHHPIYQTIGYNLQPLVDTSGQAGIRELVQQYNKMSGHTDDQTSGRKEPVGQNTVAS